MANQVFAESEDTGASVGRVGPTSFLPMGRSLGVSGATPLVGVVSRGLGLLTVIRTGPEGTPETRYVPSDWIVA